MEEQQWLDRNYFFYISHLLFFVSTNQLVGRWRMEADERFSENFADDGQKLLARCTGTDDAMWWDRVGLLVLEGVGAVWRRIASMYK